MKEHEVEEGFCTGPENLCNFARETVAN